MSAATIVAIATGPTHGAILVIRISGPLVPDMTPRLFRSLSGKPLQPRVATLGILSDGEGEIDHAVATRFVTPHSYTGEEMLELSCHGSQAVAQRALGAALALGARLAERGEFTQRAYLNGKLDLAQAEAIPDLLGARTALQHRFALSQLRGDLSRRLGGLRDRLVDLGALLELELDFSEEVVEFANRGELQRLSGELLERVDGLVGSFAGGDALREGLRVAIIGRPNAGKSTLLNTLADEELAIVSPIPGTTRDAIQAEITLGGLPVRLVDTAGLRPTEDPIEREGIARTWHSVTKAAILLILLPANEEPADHLRYIERELREVGGEATRILLLTKTDLVDASRLAALADQARTLLPDSTLLQWAAPTRAGLEALRARLGELASSLVCPSEGVVITNARHQGALLRAQESLRRLAQSLSDNTPTELVAHHLRASQHALGEITGAITPNETLARIFSRFCIGK